MMWELSYFNEKDDSYKWLIYISDPTFLVLQYSSIFYFYLMNQNTMIVFKVRMENKVWNFDRQ